MSELISKEQAIAYPLSYEHYDKVHGSKKFINGVESYRDYIDGLPAVEARKHGRWIDYPHGSGSHCSYCNFKIRYKDKNRFKFCPNCGAIMD